MDNKSEFLEEELSYALMGCFFDVRNQYGRWHKEKVYHRVLKEKFDREKIGYIYEPKIDIYSFDSGKKIAFYNPDFLAEEKIVVEIKAKRYVPKEESNRAIEYLKTSQYEILYLVNFRKEEFSPRRFIYTNDRKPFLLKAK